MKEATAALDRSFTLFFLVTSIVIMPTVTSLLAASENIADGSLLRGFIWSSVVASIMVTVGIYGFAVLLDVHWLRLAGMYGLFSIVIKAWIMLSVWLSTSRTYWGTIADLPTNYAANFACIFITAALYYLWQRRHRIRLQRLTYVVGMIASYDLFLVFSFLLAYAALNIAGSLRISFLALLSLVSAGISANMFRSRKEIGENSKAFAYGTIISSVCSETFATLILMLPSSFAILSGDLFFQVVDVLTYISIVLTVLLLLASLRKKFEKYIFKPLRERFQTRPRIQTQS